MHLFQLVECGIVLKLLAGCGFKQRPFENLTRRDRDKDSESGRMEG